MVESASPARRFTLSTADKLSITEKWCNICPEVLPETLATFATSVSRAAPPLVRLLSEEVEVRFRAVLV